MIVVTSGVESLVVKGWRGPCEQLSLSTRGLRTEDLRREALDHPVGVFAEFVAELMSARLSIFSPQVWRGADKALECGLASVRGSGISEVWASNEEMRVHLFAPDINSPASVSVSPLLPEGWGLANQEMRRTRGADDLSISALRDPNTEVLTLSVSMEISKKSLSPAAYVSLSVQNGLAICVIQAWNEWPEELPELVLCCAERSKESQSTVLTLMIWPTIPKALTKVVTER